MPAELARCPKNMVHGPCGGVGLDGACEVDPRPCVFLDSPTVGWAGDVRRSAAAPAMEPLPLPEPRAQPGAEAMRALIATRPVVVVDLPASPLSEPAIRAVAGPLRGRVDAVLAGDSGRSRVQFPPAYRARLIADAGLTPWTGLTCRDRNQVALAGELAALAHAGVGGVHCVTGDHPQTGSRPEAAAVFDLDSTELASLASRAGHLVSVAESPCAPPVDRRPARLLEKQRAGAEIAFVNHAGGIEPVRRFIDEARALGVTLGLIVCVPILLDAVSAALIQSFTTSPLPPGYAEQVLNATDTVTAGIAAATDLSLRLLDLGVAGINLSGGPGVHGEIAYADAVATISDSLALR